MASLWYPATPLDGRRARYMTPAESELQLASRGITGVPPGVLSTTRVKSDAVGNATQPEERCHCQVATDPGSHAGTGTPGQAGRGLNNQAPILQPPGHTGSGMLSVMGDRDRSL